ncbi:glycerate kinase [Bacillus sp. REN16]|uniref:glycerate kinase n=1 Tax=Bacillus sp. REN16 TaxID=2887296 RepID=UPI001E5165DE|nr:glycerate kinase [Bacillus sp. REN16]MCC3359146.1 glycerate kinase [Bacillus sp. REN16]
MKVIIAIDSFKGSISSIEGSNAISSGIKEVYKEAEIIAFPLADGGEGTVDALVQSTNGQLMKVNVTGPLNSKVDAIYGILGDGKTAVIEVAAACGLPLVPQNERNPFLTTTFGVGEIILDAIGKGCREFVIGLGGSATNDAGVGMLQALGFRFMDQFGNEVGLGGGVLQDISKIDTQNANSILADCTFKLACDVTNYLHGTDGAAYVFGPQKGATKDDVKALDHGLKHFAEIVCQELGKDIHTIKGAGAAGGLGAAFFGFLDAELQSGIELVLSILDMERFMPETDFVITGEGKLDSQTTMGKVPIGIARLAKQYQIPVIAVAGSIAEDAAQLNELGVTSYFSIMNTPMTIEEAMNPETTYSNLRVTTAQLFRLIKSLER